MNNPLENIQTLVHQLATRNGFWEPGPWSSDPGKIALMHSELSEALEAMRHGNPPSEKIDGFSQVEEELADCVIRIMDYCGQHKLRLWQAILAKHAYNFTRPYKHGKEG